MDIMQKKGKRCVIDSEFFNERNEIPFSLIAHCRINSFSLIRNHIEYNVKIDAKSNKKRIEIISDVDVEFNSLYIIAMNVIRFENLFEGKFFEVKSLLLDQKELFQDFENSILGFMRSDKSMAEFFITFDDKSYKRFFIAFEKYLKKRILPYHVTLYSLYLKGMTADLRMAQLLEVFEPLAIELNEAGKISLKICPYYTVENTCSHCGARVTKRLRNKQVRLNDLITAVIKKYGKDVFQGDSVTKIVRKAVVLRNKIDHVDNQRGAMSGQECGIYLFKFSLLYRIVVMQEIGIPYDFIKGRVNVLVEDFNKRFPNQRIRP